MKIIFCVNKDLVSNFALNHLLQIFTDHQTHIIFSEQVGKGDNILPELRFSEQEFPNNILFPQIERDSADIKARIADGKCLTFLQISEYYHTPLHVFDDINGGEAVDFVRYIQPDLVISIRYGQIFQPEIIAIPKYGVINLHSGLLPNYRGVLPSFRALFNGDEKLATTLHYISDSKIDAGEVIGFSYSPVNKEKSLFWHVVNLYEDGCKLIRDLVRKINSGDDIKHITVDRAQASYYSYPTLEEVRLFKEQGWNICADDEYSQLLVNYR
jgi:methionyl-tRNA formyltransferase